MYETVCWKSPSKSISNVHYLQLRPHYDEEEEEEQEFKEELQQWKRTEEVDNIILFLYILVTCGMKLHQSSFVFLKKQLSMSGEAISTLFVIDLSECLLA